LLLDVAELDDISGINFGPRSRDRPLGLLEPSEK
jgi:hypothetical protein